MLWPQHHDTWLAGMISETVAGKKCACLRAFCGRFILVFALFYQYLGIQRGAVI
jgi:hypothetical protein